ncbi:unnamed protein product [Acanthosepion pharaonis]|uniref:Uncharacterized protein n=1 Tax=Acanthosepion pharaonis TaxID=158019 RepID=A0A812BBN9_ACAPH|nr:unnamed protein product [Sepia pharaonis]
MRPYSCLMYVGLCVRIPLLCICVYTVIICDSGASGSLVMYADLCVRILVFMYVGSMHPSPCYAFVSIRLIYVILCVCPIPSRYVTYVGIFFVVPMYGSMRRIPLKVCICVYTVNICDSCVRSLLCMWTHASVFLFMYVGLCIRINLFAFVFILVIICDSMRPDPCYVCGPGASAFLFLCMWVYASVSPCYAFVFIRLIYVILCVRIPVMYAGPMRPYSCLMYVGHASVSPCYAFVSYTVNICGFYTSGSLVMYVDLCVRILVLCMWVHASVSPCYAFVHTVNICDSMRPDPCYVCGPMRPYSCLYVCGSMRPYPLVMHLCLYGVYVILCVRIPVMYVDPCVRILSLCMWVYVIRIPCYAFVSIRLIYADSMRPDPCYYVGTYASVYSCLMYVGLCIRILVMHLCLYG